ncbi:MAG: SufE family protein [Bauldia sp.]|nr:SufE family protein [Bauldia sp.]
MQIQQLYDDFALLDDWEDKYRYLIELGRGLEPLPDAERNADNKVSGCTSQVWLWTRVEDGTAPRLRFVGDSDAHIVKGLVAVVLTLFDGKTATEIAGIDPEAAFRRLDLAAHLSQQRSNGLRSMVARIKADARKVLAAGTEA